MLLRSNQLAPQIIGPGLQITVSSGTVFFAGFNQTVNIGATVVVLTASSTNYVYLNPATESILSSTTGFPNPSYPIAVVVTSPTGVVTITDKRADGLI